MRLLRLEQRPATGTGAGADSTDATAGSTITTGAGTEGTTATTGTESTVATGTDGTAASGMTDTVSNGGTDGMIQQADMTRICAMVETL